jgi:hypothetical protein
MYKAKSAVKTTTCLPEETLKLPRNVDLKVQGNIDNNV